VTVGLALERDWLFTVVSLFVLACSPPASGSRCTVSRRPLLQAVLFDWDGTLVNTAEANYRCYVQLFGSYGIRSIATPSPDVLAELALHLLRARPARGPLDGGRRALASTTTAARRSC